VSLYDAIRAAGGGEIVGALAEQTGVSRDQAERALRVLLPDLGRAVRRTAESQTGAPLVHAAMRDERYARYLQEPEALREPGAVADGGRVLREIMDNEQRSELVRDAAAAIGADEARARRLLPLVATLAMAALGQKMREPAPQIPWFGTDPDDRFGAPLLDALTALFEQHEESSDKRR
jgi:hypothetical protein